jgi:hypothetical protein
MKKLLCALSILAVSAIGQAQATTFGFAADVGGNVVIDQGYQGFDYGGGSGTNSWINDTSDDIDSYYGIGSTTLGAAWSNGGTPLTLTSAAAGQTFGIGSLSLDVGNTESVTIEGLLSGNVVDSWTGTIANQSAYTNVVLNWTGIDTLDLSGGYNLFVTNINTSSSNVPEPASLALVALGLLAAAVARRKTQ